jgi:hypothetical protein
MRRRIHSTSNNAWASCLASSLHLLLCDSTCQDTSVTPLTEYVASDYGSPAYNSNLTHTINDFTLALPPREWPPLK